MTDDLPAAGDDGPGPRPGQDVKTTLQSQAGGDVMIFRTEGSFTEWIISNVAVDLPQCR